MGGEVFKQALENEKYLKLESSAGETFHVPCVPALEGLFGAMVNDESDLDETIHLPIPKSILGGVDGWGGRAAGGIVGVLNELANDPREGDESREFDLWKRKLTWWMHDFFKGLWIGRHFPKGVVVDPQTVDSSKEAVRSWLVRGPLSDLIRAAEFLQLQHLMDAALQELGRWISDTNMFKNDQDHFDPDECVTELNLRLHPTSKIKLINYATGAARRSKIIDILSTAGVSPFKSTAWKEFIIDNAQAVQPRTAGHPCVSHFPPYFQRKILRLSAWSFVLHNIESTVSRPDEYWDENQWLVTSLHLVLRQMRPEEFLTPIFGKFRGISLKEFFTNEDVQRVHPKMVHIFNFYAPDEARIE